MIIVNVNSQLGNQMFQYALYRKLLYLGKKVKLDTRYYQAKPEQFALDIFNLKLNIASEKEILKARDEYRSYADRLRRKFLGKRKTIFEEITSKSLCFKPEVFTVKNAYVDGYWQSEKYFSDIRNILLKDFTFPPLQEEKNKQLLDLIRQNLSVSIHIRRGDYANGFPMLPKEYYQAAMQYFSDKYKEAFFVVFSNDNAWAKENITFEKGIFVDWNTGRNSYKDMYLMSQCRHNIIANSSFSWWGAWLNSNENKEVIAPDIWFFHHETPDIYCEGWKILSIQATIS
jgi:hypothetical protein